VSLSWVRYHSEIDVVPPREIRKARYLHHLHQPAYYRRLVRAPDKIGSSIISIDMSWQTVGANMACCILLEADRRVPSMQGMQPP